MAVLGSNGVNIAVKNLEEARYNFESLLNVTPEYRDESCFSFPNLEGYRFNIGNFKINIISSKTEDTSIGRFLKKNGEGLFLLSLEVDDCTETVSQISKQNNNIKFVLEKEVTPPNGTSKVNFIHPKSLHGVQVELIENRHNK